MAVIAKLDIQLSTNTAQLSAGFAKASLHVKTFGEKIKSAGEMMKGMFAYELLKKGIESFKGFVEEQTRFITGAAKMADALGMSVQAFTGLQDGLEKSGIDAEAFEKNILHMREGLANAAGGSHEAQKAFATLGVNLQDIINLPADQQMEAIAEGFKNAGNSVSTTSAVMQIFGARTGLHLLPILARGAQGLRDMKDEADRTGQSVKAIDAEQVRLATRAMGDMVDPIKAAANTFIIELSPYIKAAADNIGTMLEQVRQLAPAFSDALVPLKAIVKAQLDSIGNILTGYKALAMVAKMKSDPFEAFRMFGQIQQELAGGGLGEKFFDDAQKAREQAQANLDAKPQQAPAMMGGGQAGPLQTAGAALKDSIESYKAILADQRRNDKDKLVPIAQKQLEALNKMANKGTVDVKITNWTNEGRTFVWRH